MADLQRQKGLLMLPRFDAKKNDDSQYTVVHLWYKRSDIWAKTNLDLENKFVKNTVNTETAFQKSFPLPSLYDEKLPLLYNFLFLGKDLLQKFKIRIVTIAPYVDPDHLN